MNSTSATVTVSMSQELRNALEKRAEEVGQSRSATVCTDLQTYWSLLHYGLRQASRVLTRAEVCLILDTIRATWTGLTSFDRDVAAIWAQPAVLVMEIEDACRFEALDTKWHVDRSQLIEKIQSMDSLARFALLDWIGTMWQHCTDTDRWGRELARFVDGQETQTRQTSE